MIDQAICQALNSTTLHECGSMLMKQQIAGIILIALIPYVLFLLLFVGIAKFKKNALLYILIIAGFPLLMMIIALLAFPYIINTI